MLFRPVTLLCLGGACLLTSVAAAQEDHFDDVDLSAYGADPNHDAGRETIDSGFVFIDGEFVAAPYDVGMSEDGQEVLVNGRVMPGAVPKRPPGAASAIEPRPGRDAANRRGGFGRQPWGPAPLRGIWARRVREHLEMNNAVVAFAGQQMRILTEENTYSLLKSLQKLDTQSDHYGKVMGIPQGPEAVVAWKQWLQTFAPDDTFQQQIEPFLTWLEAAEAKNHAEAAAVRRFNAVAYPLTLVGMLLSVIAFGHLLMSLPNNDAMRRGSTGGEAGGGISGEVVRATMISVVLVAVLSSLDLTWTILAAQAGQMRELNPIASHFINDPLALIAFKSSATLLGCGLLLALRRHSRAQLASWWMCLVLTMLTFRWLMFNSMFVT